MVLAPIPVLAPRRTVSLAARGTTTRTALTTLRLKPPTPTPCASIHQSLASHRPRSTAQIPASKHCSPSSPPPPPPSPRPSPALRQSSSVGLLLLRSIASSSRSPQAAVATTTGRSTSFASHALPTVSLEHPAAPGRSPKVVVTWGSGTASAYHAIWLRDHCRCPSCYHTKTKQRLVSTFQIPPDVAPLAAEATTEGLLVEWPAGAQERAEIQAGATTSETTSIVSSAHESPSHTSLYPWHWLRRNAYASATPNSTSSSSTALGLLDDGRGANDDAARVLWGRGIAQDPPKVRYEEVMRDDFGVYKWVSKIARFGFCFVSGVPPTPEHTEELVRRIAFIRETHYGGFWDFTSNLEHGDTAYTDLALGAHTDTTYFTDPAGLQLFHLLSHEASSAGGVPPSGGESLLVDGFLAAKVLKEVHPDAYATLSRTRILTHSAGDDDTLVQPLERGGYPILHHDAVTGELVLVRYNNDDRSVLRVREDEVEPFYDALRKWHDVITSPDGEYWCQLTPGNALIFDNHRVLHGRSAFVGARRLCGAYVSHDDYRSRLATLCARYAAAAGMGGAEVGSDRATKTTTTTTTAGGDAAVSQVGAGGGASGGQTAAEMVRDATTGGSTLRSTRGVWDDGL